MIFHRSIGSTFLALSWDYWLASSSHPSWSFAIFNHNIPMVNENECTPPTHSKFSLSLLRKPFRNLGVPLGQFARLLHAAFGTVFLSFASQLSCHNRKTFPAQFAAFATFQASSSTSWFFFYQNGFADSSTAPYKQHIRYQKTRTNSFIHRVQNCKALITFCFCIVQCCSLNKKSGSSFNIFIVEKYFRVPLIKQCSENCQFSFLQSFDHNNYSKVQLTENSISHKSTE